MNDCEKFQPLIAGLIDGELTTDEATDLNQHLTRCSDCRDEHEKLRNASGKLEAISFIEAEDEVLENLWKSPYHRFTRNAGLWMVIGGYLVLILFALWQMIFHIDFRDFFNPDGETIPALSLAAILIGFFILLFNVIRERRKTWKVDPYKNIKR